MSETLSSLASQRDSEPLTGDALVGETLTSRDASTVEGGVDIFLVFLEEGKRVVLLTLAKKCGRTGGFSVENN